MKLSMSLLANYLAGHVPESYIVSEQRSIIGVRFLSDQQRYSSDYVYLGRAAEYFQDRRYADALLLVSGENQLIVHGTDYEELLNDVLAAFEYYNGMERRLFEAAASHQPLEAVLQTAGEMLTGAVMVFDLEGVLLGAVHQDALLGEDEIAGLSVGDSMDPMILSKKVVDAEGQMSHDLSERPQHLKIQGHAVLGSVNMYLTQDGERVGFLMIFPGTANEVLCGLMLEEELADYIVQTAEFTDGGIGSRSTHGMLESLLEGNEIAAPGYERIRGVLGDPEQYCVLAYRNRSIQNYTMYTLWRREMEAHFPACQVVLYEDHVVLIAGAQHVAAVRQSILRRYPREMVQLGVSMAVASLRELHRAYRQAMFALERVGGAGTVYCRDLAAEYMMEVLAGDALAAAMEHPALGQLRAYDVAGGAELLATLEAYLRCGCRQRNAAETLHVHLNTLKYRLHRIGEITGVDLEDPEEQFYLNLSLRMNSSLGTCTKQEF